jgi:hypothetical protein
MNDKRAFWACLRENWVYKFGTKIFVVHKCSTTCYFRIYLFMFFEHYCHPFFSHAELKKLMERGILNNYGNMRLNMMNNEDF